VDLHAETARMDVVPFVTLFAAGSTHCPSGPLFVRAILRSDLDCYLRRDRHSSMSALDFPENPLVPGTALRPSRYCV